MEQGRRRHNNFSFNNNNNNNNNNMRKDRCLTMHQPWASLLVFGIKRIEGRSWPSPLTGRLWIHAASKVPDHETVKIMEKFYRVIYARDGITDLEFPQQYPVSRLIGCIEVVGCLRRKELACWKEVPEGVRLEALTDFCWLCEHPQKLTVPLQMGGWKGVYDLDSKINEADIGSLVRVEIPLPLKFPLPNPQDPSSLKPGSLSSLVLIPEIEKTPILSAVIDAASKAAIQFSNKGHSFKSNSFDDRNKGNVTIPEDVRFVRNSQYTGSYHFDNGNHKYSSRPAATQYVRNSYTSTSTQSVPSDQIDGNSYLGNNTGTNCQIENEDNCKDHRSNFQINEAARGSLVRAKSPLLVPEVEKPSMFKEIIDATQLSNKKESSKTNGFDNRNKGNFTRPEDVRFVGNNRYTGNFRFDNRKQRYIYRPVALQYEKKEQNMVSIGESRNQSDSHTSMSTHFVQSNQIDGIEKEEIHIDHRSTPHYTGNYRFDNRNQRHIYRPVVTQYAKKEQNLVSNGENSRKQSDSHTSMSTHFVQSNQIDGIEKKENHNDHRSTPHIFAAAVRGIWPSPRPS